MERPSPPNGSLGGPPPNGSLGGPPSNGSPPPFGSGPPSGAPPGMSPSGAPPGMSPSGAPPGMSPSGAPPGMSPNGSMPHNDTIPPLGGIMLNGSIPLSGNPRMGGIPDGSALPSGQRSSNSTISTELRLIGASSFLTLTILSLLANFLLLAVFIKGYKKFKTMPFFIIAFQMLISDFMGLIVDVVLVVPITFAGYDLYGETINYIIAYSDSISFSGDFFFVLLLTINRFVTFIFPKIDKFMFGNNNIYGSIFVTWLITCGFAALMGVGGCLETYNVQEYHIELVCSQNRADWSFFIQDFQMYMTEYIPILMMAIYVFLFIEIKFRLSYVLTHFRKPMTGSQENRKEYLILLQSLILCGIFELKFIVLQMMPGLRVSMEDENLVQVITFAHTWVTIANNTVHAIVIFLFNSIAREVFWKMIGWKKKNNSIEKKNTTKVSIIQVKPALTRRGTVP